jgi:hypothetical protein
MAARVTLGFGALSTELIYDTNYPDIMDDLCARAATLFKQQLTAASEAGYNPLIIEVMEVEEEEEETSD